MPILDSSASPETSYATFESTTQTRDDAGSRQLTAPMLMGRVFPEGVTTPKIMIVGDSISATRGCYKGYLDQNLRAHGITSYEFVGKYEDGCGSGIRHSAVSCSTTSDYVKDTFVLAKAKCAQTPFDGMARLAAEFTPDLIMLQLGVNDVWNGDEAIEPILANYTTLVEQARAVNERVVVVVAQINKVITQNCPESRRGPVNTSAEALVAAIPAWAQSVSTDNSRVLTADLWTNSDTTLTSDCVHPNTDGAKQMGLDWYNALKDLLTL